MCIRDSNKYLTVTDMGEMGKYTFENLEGYENFAENVKSGDIVVAGKNFGSGSSRQQAVDCFLSLGVSCIIAESYGAIYERNAINAALPIVVCRDIKKLKIKQGDRLSVNFETGIIKNLQENLEMQADTFSEVQMEIYQNNGLF